MVSILTQPWLTDSQVLTGSAGQFLRGRHLGLQGRHLGLGQRPLGAWGSLAECCRCEGTAFQSTNMGCPSFVESSSSLSDGL